MAQQAVSAGLATSLMDTAEIFSPDDHNSQKFITVTPEPATAVFLSTGVLLMSLSRIRRRR